MAPSMSEFWKVCVPISLSYFPRKLCTVPSGQHVCTSSRWEGGDGGGVSFLVQIFVQARPDWLEGVWRYADEVYVILEALLQAHFLRGYGMYVCAVCIRTYVCVCTYVRVCVYVRVCACIFVYGC